MADVRKLAGLRYRVNLHQRVNQSQNHLLAVSERSHGLREDVNGVTENISECRAVRDWTTGLSMALAFTPCCLAVITILPPFPENKATLVLAGCRA